MQFGDQDSESDEDGGHTQRLRFEPCIAIASHSLHHACTCMHIIIYTYVFFLCTLLSLMQTV